MINNNMKRIIYLFLMSLFVLFTACEDDDKGDTSISNDESVVDILDGEAYTCDGTESGHDYVDLGLTSGTMWATTNIGAKEPQSNGDFFAWGETSPKGSYSWSSYEFGYGLRRLTKYCSKADFGEKEYVDTKNVLDEEDDAAHVNWGGKWIMPTHEQQKELIKQCYWVWTSNYNKSKVAGYVVFKAKSPEDKGVCTLKGEVHLSSYSLSDAHIFLPATGTYLNSFHLVVGKYGEFWSSSLNTSSPSFSWTLSFESSYVVDRDNGRYWGMPVRPVFKP